MKRLRRFSARLRAFSLIECLMAVAIMAVLTLPILTAQRLAHRANLGARHHVQALFLANQVIETLRHDNDRSCERSEGLVALSPPRVELPPGFTLDVKRIPRSGGLMEARVTIRWTLAGRAVKTSCSTLLSLLPNRGVLSKEDGS